MKSNANLKPHRLWRWLAASLAWCCSWAGLVPAQQASGEITLSTTAGPAAKLDSKPNNLLAERETDSRYRIGPGDVLTIQIYNRPQLSREAVRVDGQGNIHMPWIEDEIHVACRTETEVAEEIITRYRPLLRAPQVGVFIKEYQSQPVAVIGAVNQPGRFQLQRRVRLLELLTYAGGPSERAGRNVQIIHTTPKQACEQSVSLQPASPASASPASASPASASPASASPASASPAPAEAPRLVQALGTPATARASTQGTPADDVYAMLELNDVLLGKVEVNPYIRPGDIVTLPEADQVFVVGSVLRPAPLVLRGQLTVSQAIAMAGGLMPDAKTDKVQIVRQTPTGKAEIVVDLKAIEKQQAEDVALQPNDIVNVHVAGARSFFRTILSAVAPAVGQLPVRVVN